MKKLYRNTQDKMLFGVCSGIADYFNLDPTIIRALWAVAALCGGFGVIAYIVLAIIIPENPMNVE